MFLGFVEAPVGVFNHFDNLSFELMSRKFGTPIQKVLISFNGFISNALKGLDLSVHNVYKVKSTYA